MDDYVPEFMKVEELHSLLLCGRMCLGVAGRGTAFWNTHWVRCAEEMKVFSKSGKFPADLSFSNQVVGGGEAV